MGIGFAARARSQSGAGIRFFSFPIPDRQTSRSAEKLRGLTDILSALLANGQSVAVHCRQSVGRSALLAAVLLVEAGISPDDAFDRIQRARGCPVPDTPEQRLWVERFAKREEKPPPICWKSTIRPSETAQWLHRPTRPVG
jgi:protein-tyrosine phosphatase